MSASPEGSTQASTVTGFSKCPLCEEVIKDKAKYVHFRNAHPEQLRDYPQYREKFVPASPLPTDEEQEVGPPSGLEPRQLVAQFGREGLNQVKRDRLQKVLELAPGVGSKAVPFILHKWDVNARVRDDPQELFNTLHMEAGLKPNTAQSIVKDVFSVEEEFADLLEKRGEVPIFFRPRSLDYGYGPSGYTYGPTGYGYGYQHERYRGQPGQPQPFLTRDEFLAMEREREERRRREDEVKGLRDSHKALSERVEKLDRDLAAAMSTSFKELEEKLTERIEGVKGAYEEVEVPIDAQGNPCPPEEAVSVKRIRRPVTAGGESFVDQYTKLRQAGLIPTSKEITEDTIRRIVREEKPPPESEEVKALKASLQESREKIDELEDKMEAKDRQLLLDKISGLESRLAGLGGLSGEWKSDEMKLIAGAIKELAETIRAKEPMETVKEVLLPGSSSPPSVEGGAGPSGEAREELRRRGLLVRLAERRR